MNQYIIIQGELSVAVKTFTEKDNRLEVYAGNVLKVISAPKGLYLHPRELRFIGSYTIVTQREKGSKDDI